MRVSRTVVLAAFAAMCLQMACDGSQHVAEAQTGRNAWRPRPAGPHQAWRMEPELRWQQKRLRLHLRGGGDDDVRMEVDSAPDAVAVDAKQGESKGLVDASSGAPGGAVNVTVKWKLSSFPLEIDTWQSADVLKSQLYSITQVVPDEQFLIGVYQPGQDTNLKGLDLKQSQTLIMLGEPSRVQKDHELAPSHAEVGGVGSGSGSPGGAEEECRMDLDDADTVATTACDDTAAVDIDVAPPCIYKELPKRGHFSLTNIIANNKLDYLRSLRDNVTGLEKPLPEVSELLNATNLFSGSGVAELEPVKMNEDLAPTTLPREFWNKKIVDYDDNERARLKL